MNDIKFERGRGGLGRALAGKDHVSGLVIVGVGANFPAALLAEPFVTIYSPQDATDLGLTYTEAQDNLEVDTLAYLIETIYQQNAKAVLHLQIENATTGGTLAAGLIALQNNAQGEIRQALVVDPAKAFVSADLTALQASCDTLEAQHKPLSVIYAADFAAAGVALDDLRALDNKNVGVIYGMDGNGKGAALFAAYGNSFTCAGAALGVVSKAKVNENIAWVGAFNVNKNEANEFDVIDLGDGSSVSNTSQTELDALNTKGYIFLIKHVGKAGSYFNDSHCAIGVNDDFAYLENNRTIDKAVRDVRTELLPHLNSPLYVNEDGTLTEDTIAEFKNDAEKSLEKMEVNGEISFGEVEINPEQDVLGSSKITLTISIIPAGVARNIKVNIGLTVRAATA